MAMQNKGTLYTAVTGLIMGMAEVVPGVSGGTIAFVAGVYEKLLETIDTIRQGVFNLPEQGIKGLVDSIDWRFIFSLGVGMGTGIIVGVFSITHFLEHYPPVIWSFFFGLIVASSIYMISKIDRSGFSWLLVLLGAIIAFGIGTYSYGAGNTSWWFILVCGMIAITALVLPGISGSFMLLMLGMYTYIIQDTLKGLITNFSTDKLLDLSVFAIGCLLGLFSIARLLRWALDKHYNTTVAILTGFMIGSLQRIWPWRSPTLVLDKLTGKTTNVLPEGEYKIISEALVWPNEYPSDPMIIGSILAFAIGLSLIAAFSKFESQGS